RLGQQIVTVAATHIVETISKTHIEKANGLIIELKLQAVREGAACRIIKMHGIILLYIHHDLIAEASVIIIYPEGTISIIEYKLACEIDSHIPRHFGLERIL